MIREFDAESSSRQTALSATQSGMFPHILEKRWNRHVGREWRAAVQAETAMAAQNADSARFVSV